jgi:hypothetical protein
VSCAGCGNLVVPNAEVIFSRGFLINSTATQMCTNGSVPSGTSTTRTCTISGWDEVDLVCGS